jgi:hypothetical protein
MAHFSNDKFVIIALAISLGACGGGGGGGGGIGFIPPPGSNPPSGDPPPHTFSATYADQVFGGRFTATIDTGTGAATNLDIPGLSQYGEILVQKNVNEYAIWAGNSVWDYDFPIFSDSTLGADPTSGDETGNFDYYRFDSAQLQLLKPGPANTRIQLTYLTYGVYSNASGPDTARVFSTAVFALGQETAPASMPTSGTGSYSGIVDGHGSVGGTAYRLLGSTGTLSANFATGAITTSLLLQGNTDFLTGTLGTTQAFGTLTGSGTIGSGTSRYVGSLTGFGMTGEFDGGFFGPAANETGYGFYAYTSGGNLINGVFVGKQ